MSVLSAVNNTPTQLASKHPAAVRKWCFRPSPHRALTDLPTGLVVLACCTLSRNWLGAIPAQRLQLPPQWLSLRHAKQGNTHVAVLNHTLWQPQLLQITSLFANCRTIVPSQCVTIHGQNMSLSRNSATWAASTCDVVSCRHNQAQKKTRRVFCRHNYAACNHASSISHARTATNLQGQGTHALHM